jgi:enoyl-CoA hydratase
MIEHDSDDGIATLRMAHGKANALDAELLRSLKESLDEVERGPARAVVLTGTGSIFSAGVDLFRLIDGGPSYVFEFFPLLAAAIRRLFLFPKPLVAATNGHAIAGGCILTAACDYRIMAAGKGRIGVPELLVGVPFPAVALEVLRFATPPQHLQNIIYSGRTFLPEEAVERGLVDEVAEPEELSCRASDVARQFAGIPAEAFRMTKMQLRQSSIERAEGHGALADAAAERIWSAADTHRGIRDYLTRTIGKR